MGVQRKSNSPSLSLRQYHKKDHYPKVPAGCEGACSRGRDEGIAGEREYENLWECGCRKLSGSLAHGFIIPLWSVGAQWCLVLGISRVSDFWKIIWNTSSSIQHLVALDSATHLNRYLSNQTDACFCRVGKKKKTIISFLTVQLVEFIQI